MRTNEVAGELLVIYILICVVGNMFQLFGPKWSSHMPKYAANLSVAPLQPQKQASAPSNVSQSEPVTDKVASKPATWSDPFTSDGQECKLQ